MFGSLFVCVIVIVIVIVIVSEGKGVERGEGYFVATAFLYT